MTVFIQTKTSEMGMLKCHSIGSITYFLQAVLYIYYENFSNTNKFGRRNTVFNNSVCTYFFWSGKFYTISMYIYGTSLSQNTCM